MPLIFNYEPQETRANLIAPSLYTSYKPTALPTVGDVMYKNMDVKKVEPTTEGVTERIYTPSLASAVPTLDSVIRKINLPSYIPSDTPAGLISRDDWDNFDDVNFYVGTDGKYYSTDPYFNRVIFRESSHVLNPSPTSSHRGPTQFDKATWERVMPNVPYAHAVDPKYAGQAAVALAKANAAGLKKSNLPVNGVTVYGAHNLGLGGISNILKNPDNPLPAVVINNMQDWKKFKKVPQELRDKISNHPEALIGRDYLDYLSYIFTN